MAAQQPVDATDDLNSKMSAKAAAHEKELKELMCRVCRCEGTPTSPLQHPCLCSGSIKYIHKDCLSRWLEVSKRNICELCGHQFIFKKVYAADMPDRLPWIVLMRGLRDLANYVFAALVWILLVPLAIGYFSQLLFCRDPRTILYQLDSYSLVEHLAFVPSKLFSVAMFSDNFVVGMVLLVVYVGLSISVCHLYSAIVKLKPSDLSVNILSPPVVDSDVEDIQDDDDGENENDDVAPGAAGFPIFDQNQYLPSLNWTSVLGLDATANYLIFAFAFVIGSIGFVLLLSGLFFIGNTILTAFDLDTFTLKLFREIICGAVGSVAVAFLLKQVNIFCRWRKHETMVFLTGITYLLLKFFIYILVKVFLFPIMSGFFMSVCSMNVFGSTIEALIGEFSDAPATTTVTHWVQGHILNLCLCQFIIEIRKFLRTGIIWFFIDFEDPELNPIKNIISGSVKSHIHGFLWSSAYFMFAILLVMWMPMSLLRLIVPNLLPFKMDLSLLPVLIERLQIPFMLLFWLFPSMITREWCYFWGDRMDLRSYLFADQQVKQGDLIVEADGKLVRATKAEPLRTIRTKTRNISAPYYFTCYRRPEEYFRTRLTLFCTFSCLGIVGVCLVNYGASLLIARSFQIILPDVMNQVAYLALGFIFYEMVGKLVLKSMLALIVRQYWICQAAVAQMGDYVFYFVVVIIGVCLVFLVPAVMGHLLVFTLLAPIGITTTFTNASPALSLDKWLIGLETIFIMLPITTILCYLDLFNGNRSPESMDPKTLIASIIKLLCKSVVFLIASLTISYCFDYFINQPLSNVFFESSITTQHYMVCFTCGIAFLYKVWTLAKNFHQKIRDDRYLLGEELVNH